MVAFVTTVFAGGVNAIATCVCVSRSKEETENGELLMTEIDEAYHRSQELNTTADLCIKSAWKYPHRI
ncbi:hypothetical protein L2E82_46751 [Cichorium intybus]|uniref:Uncharacterized protein n=1 Tax=Cichorium intybus TaxID=13427 RepID=A0ACB8YUF0_CICIN|nr:hypothetical protein L2E82_46751 [Cichorium intybus]